MRSRSSPVETANRGANLVHLGLGEPGVHRKQEDTLEQSLRARQPLPEPELLPLVHRLSSPGKQSTDAAFGQKRLQLVAALRLNLVVLIHIEVLRIAIGTGRKRDFGHVLQ